MKRIHFCLLLSLLLLVFTACQEKQPAARVYPAALDSITSDTAKRTDILPTDSIWARNCRLITDSIMPRYKDLVRYYFQKYRPDTCGAILLDSAGFEDFEGVLSIGRIRRNKPPVSVFVWPQLSWCDLEGNAYYFTDTTLPRLETESVCCHPQSLFPVGDIDEDGIAEIGQYLSSCVSRFKSLHVYTLKNNEWKEAGSSMFDIFYMNAEKGFRQYVRKTGKGRFEMLEITDAYPRKEAGEKNWLEYSF